MDDPTKFRMIQTRDGVTRIPREQQGVPIKDYFQNVDLPSDLEKGVVYASATGPVLAKPDPQPWAERHSEMANEFAAKLKVQIEDKGYYSKTLNIMSGQLADETGYPREEMKAMIVSKFDEAYQVDPFTHLQNCCEAKGLPVREAPEQSQRIEQEQG